VRKKPGSTSIVRMPNGATSEVNDSIQPSTSNLEAAHAVRNFSAGEAGGRGDRDHQARALGAHHRQNRAGDVDRAEQGGLDLGPEVPGADLL